MIELRKLKILLFSSLMFFVGFQCSTTEITSARLYLQQKNYPKALEVLQKEVKKNPQSDEGFYLMGLVYAEMENYDSMLIAFDRSMLASNKYEKEIISIKTNAWVTNLNKGIGFYNKAANSKDVDSANSFYYKSLEAAMQASVIIPDSAESYNIIVLIHMNQKNYDLAVKPLIKLTEIKPTNSSFLQLAAVLNNQAERNKLAYDTTKVDSFMVNYNAKLTESVFYLEKGIELFPEDVDLYTTLIEDYDKLGQSDKGLAKLKLSVESNPTNANYRYLYGYVLLRKAQYAEAVKQLEEAEKLDPKYIDAIYSSTVAYYNWGVEIRKAADDKNSTTEGLDKEKFNSALAACERLLKVADKEPKYWELYAKINSVLGNTKAAEDAFKKADELRTKK
ncbi:MAG: tetratricopeptide repeat protein [Bdellovibrionaceae bacterium]|nr:tetratricopeptide repeat protein [Pseudobdellovibrionaceae bacterium]MCK6606323.1 tetratricopeptide repeat protein [Ignavibacteriaceae bacterium]